MSDDVMWYAAFNKDGDMVAARYDDPERPRETAKDVASYIRDGYRVERVSVDATRLGIAAYWAKLKAREESKTVHSTCTSKEKP